MEENLSKIAINKLPSSASVEKEDFFVKDTGTETSKVTADNIAKYVSESEHIAQKIAASAEGNVQSDWNVTDTASDAYIKNKPTAMPASDVSPWAKAATKPVYTKNDVGLGNVPNVTTDDQTPTFTQASARANIASGEKLSVILGKVMKWFSDLQAAAFSGSYDDLINKPTIPTKTSELTNDSGYTTTDNIATQSTAGLMSAVDKKNLDTMEADMISLKKSVSDGKSTVASAITAQGVTTAADASYETMALNITSAGNEKYNAGYNAGASSVTVKTQTKTVTPNASNQTVNPDSGYYLSAVTVNAIPYSESSNSAGGTTVTIG